MYIAMDMGTSNTRLWLCDNDKISYNKKFSFGAKLGKIEGRNSLFLRLKEALKELLDTKGLKESDIECIITSGMSGSEIGLCDIPHTTLPSDKYASAKNISRVTINEITDIQFLFVPGLKACKGDTILDIMRGEETEIYGILSHLPKGRSAIVVLPGTHNKVIKVNENSEITDFCTTFSGELLDMIISESILSGSVSHDFTLSQIYAKRGMEFALTKGLNAAIFHVRIMGKNGASSDAMSSFLYGAVLGEDAKLISDYSANSTVYVGGNQRLQELYCLLLDKLSPIALSRDICDSAVLCGLSQTYKLYNNQKTSKIAKEAIEREKIISIVRKPDMSTVEKAVDALYNGGIRLIEVTFDRSGEFSAECTCNVISMIHKKYRERMLVGAGTVTRPEEVYLAYEAGASYIISPNCDPEIIKLTKKLGLVSIPAAFTATEIAFALNSGADYIKLFPADQASKEYVKAIKAPLSDAKLLAVGGVTADNAKNFIENGFLGIGVGSNLYNKKLIEANDFNALTKLANEYVQAVK